MALRLLFPLLLAVPPWIWLGACLKNGARVKATWGVLLWVLALAVGGAWAEYHNPGLCGQLFWGAEVYAQNMLHWARTGEGCESQLQCFLPQHGLHLATFSLATAATSGLLGLAFAATLLGWMGAYTGQLAACSSTPWLAALLAWHPWAVVRVVSYTLLGLLLSEISWRRREPPLPGRQRLLWWSLVGLLLDVLLKATLAHWWQRALLRPLLLEPGNPTPAPAPEALASFVGGSWL